MKETLPEHFQSFIKEYPQVWDAHQKLSEACANCGPLDRKTRELIKVAIAGAANQTTALQRHVVMAMQAGATEEEVYQAILLLITTVGFPRASAAMQWAKSVLTTPCKRK
jgi:4-carboxymuconolactone decarboxylase